MNPRTADMLASIKAGEHDAEIVTLCQVADRRRADLQADDWYRFQMRVEINELVRDIEAPTTIVGGDEAHRIKLAMRAQTLAQRAIRDGQDDLAVEILMLPLWVTLATGSIGGFTAEQAADLVAKLRK